MKTIRTILLVFLFCQGALSLVKAQGHDGKVYSVKHVGDTTVEASRVPALLDAEGISFERIASVNWAAYPYQPYVLFRMAHTGNALLLQYHVEEECVAALAQDGGAVFRDACCEFFVSPTSDGIYYNFETNCIGSLLMEAGTGRGDQRGEAPNEVASLLQRWASLGCEPFPLRRQPTTWDLVLVIPVEAFFRHTLTTFSGLTMRGNLYKCGHGLCRRHYVSWNPIRTPKPDFHQPAFFGTLIFE
mgnify:CR=1 FL=1